MKKVAHFIVTHKTIFLILILGILAYCGWGMTQVKVEYDITSYLPQQTDTRKTITIMDEEFVTYGTASILVRNLSYDSAVTLHDEIEALDGVKSFPFENTEDYYKDSCALFSITFDNTTDDTGERAYNATVGLLGGYDYLVATSPSDSYADELQHDINFVLLLAVAVIILVLCLTSSSFGEVPVLLLTFIVAAILNMGTNYWFGTISFVSNSVCVILQLALAIDYAIILCHRFAEEKAKCGGNITDAMTNALAKAFPEICGSSLTTIAGLLALTTMALRLGADLGLVLAKSILCSMFSVFLFMPCIMLLFSKLIDKTKHRSFVPSVNVIGKINVKLRHVLPVLFLGIVGVCTYFSFNTDYVYSTESIDTNRPSSSMVAQAEIDNIFGKNNQFVILMPVDDYEGQKLVLDMVQRHPEITDGLGVANQEIKMNGNAHTLTEQLNYKDLSVFLGASDEMSQSVYGAYAFFRGEDTRKGLEELAIFRANPDIYTASLLELCDCAFLHDDFISAYLYDDADALADYRDVRDLVKDAEDQLIGSTYTRMLFNMNTAVESEETFALIQALTTEVKSLYPEALFAGNSMSAYDLDQSFSTDNIMVSVLTVLFVFIILIFTFRSWGLPIPLTLTIQGAIFINFSYYAIFGTNLFFFVYLIVSAIQMGATIDYAIVLTSRFQELQKTSPPNEAMIASINQVFPTIMTSGTIMAVAGFLIGGVVSDPLIATLGLCLGRGVIVSILCVLFVLPATLLLFHKPLNKTIFKRKKPTLNDAKTKLPRFASLTFSKPDAADNQTLCPETNDQPIDESELQDLSETVGTSADAPPNCSNTEVAAAIDPPPTFARPAKKHKKQSGLSSERKTPKKTAARKPRHEETDHENK